MMDIEDIRNKAAELGFDDAAVTDAGPIAKDQTGYLRHWLKSGCAARMTWMHRNFYKRTNPANLLQAAQSVIVVALNYTPAERLSPPEEPAGRVAHYARYNDYHSFMKTRLRELADHITASAEGQHRFKICVDSAPLAERALAQRANLGFIGRNHLLIHPKLGPQIFLGEIITTIPPASTSVPQPITPRSIQRSTGGLQRTADNAGQLQAPAAQPPDRPENHPCADCDRCIKACPTGALSPDGGFDARKCISYLTIEHQGPIDEDLAPKIANHLFGCDNCVLACPFTAQAPPASNPDLTYHPERAWINLVDLLEMTAEQFNAAFADSPLHRTGLQNLQATARICLRNLHS